MNGSLDRHRGDYLETAHLRRAVPSVPSLTTDKAFSDLDQVEWRFGAFPVICSHAGRTAL